MARENADREDLLREATALVERVELEISGLKEPIVVGFRRDGAISFYFGPNIVYQFNANNELRRGFSEDKLIKAVDGRLAALTPRRTADRTELLRHDLTDVETAKFLDGAMQNLKSLSQSLSGNHFKIVGQVPPDLDIVGRIVKWLDNLPAEIPVAGSPRL